MANPSKQLRVAEVISNSTIVINGGENEQIEHGDEFIVYETGPEIIDPKTKDSLGQLDVKKGRFVAVDVQPQLTIARVKKNTITRDRRRPDLFNPMRRMLYEEYEVEVTESVKMEVSEASYTDALVIHKNDLVRRT